MLRSISALTALLLVALACGSSNRNEQPKGPIRGIYPDGRLTDEGGKYLGAAVGYFASTHEYNKKLAIRMVHSGTGKATLGEVRTEIEDRQRIEYAAFFGDYKSVVVPTEFADIDAQINQVHDGYEAAFEEYLEYWSDHNRSHIQSGTARFQDALKQADSVVKQLGKRMDQVKR